MNHFNLYLLALVIVSAADVAVTHRNLRRGGRELNYVPAKLMAKFGPWPVMIGTKAIIVGVGLWANHPAYYSVATVMTLAAVFYSLAAKGKGGLRA